MEAGSAIPPAPGVNYEPPAIEQVLAAEDLEREVLYAGQIITNDFLRLG